MTYISHPFVATYGMSAQKEISNEDYQMFLEYTIHYWKNKAKRARQAYQRELLLRKEAESELKRISVIPKDILEALINSHKVIVVPIQIQLPDNIPKADTPKKYDGFSGYSDSDSGSDSESDFDGKF